MVKLEQVQDQDFDGNRIYNHVKRFSFPRLAGTEGEKKAVDLTVNTFKKIGFPEENIKKHLFQFSDFYSTTLIKLIMILNLLFNFFLLFFVYILPIVTIIVVGSFAILLIWIIRSVQNLRKEARLSPGDKIKLFYQEDGVENLFSKYGEFLQKEVGAEKVSKKGAESFIAEKEVKLNGRSVFVGIQKSA